MDPVTPVHQLFHLCGLVQMRQSAKIARVEKPLYVTFGTMVVTMVDTFFFGPKTLVVDLKAAGRKLIPKS